MLRCLRPIRLITQSHPLRKEVWQVLRGYKDLLKMVILFFIFLVCFASYAVQAFAHKLEKCNDPTVITKQACTGYFEVPLADPEAISDLKVNAHRRLSVQPSYGWAFPWTLNLSKMCYDSSLLHGNRGSYAVSKNTYIVMDLMMTP